MPETLVVLLGPTAVGKTELAIALARQLGTDIISADSRQIYQGIPIGTAAPTPEQLAQVRHHFVQILPLEAYFSAAMYEEAVMRLIEAPPPNPLIEAPPPNPLPITGRGEDTTSLLEESMAAPTPSQHSPLPVMGRGLGGGAGGAGEAILCGGSMLYIDAVCRGMDNIPTIRDDIRDALKARLATEGLPVLFKELQALDPDYAAEVDAQNPRRVLHALEVCVQSGQPFSSFRQRNTSPRPFRIVKVGLNRPRASLFERINRRVDMMMAEGLLAEAERVYPLRHLNALNTVGYKELFNVLDGQWELPMAVERIKKNTRVYAKKQLTWFLRDPEIHWFDLDSMPPAQVLDHVGALLSASNSPVEG